MFCKKCQGKLIRFPKQTKDTLPVYSCTKCGETFYEILDELYTIDELYKIIVSLKKDGDR